MNLAINTLLLISSLAWAQEPVRLHTDLGNKGDVWVGQRTSLYVTVLMMERPSASPRFTLPEVEGALFRQAPGSPVVGSQRVDGAELTTQRFELMLFPQRAGTIAIPAVEVRVRLAGELHELTSDALQLTCKLPAGVEPGTPLITTTSLDIRQSWSPEPARMTVGDAFRRTITIRADDVMAIAIPPAPVPRPQGLAAYEGEPALDDKIQRGALNSTRTDEVTYVCTSVGTFELPELVYRWWDPSTQMLREKRLPGVQFEVAPDPAAVNASNAFAGADHERSTAPVWVAMLAGICALAGLLARKQLAARWNAWRAQRQASEPAHFARFQRAARASDPVRAWSTLTDWMDCAAPASNAWVALEFAQRHGTAGFAHDVEGLQLTLVASNRAWNANALRKSAEQTRRAMFGGSRARRSALPALNGPRREQAG